MGKREEITFSLTISKIKSLKVAEKEEEKISFHEFKAVKLIKSVFFDY